MKKITILLLCMVHLGLMAQNIGINATGALPNASAMLDISATNKGMLIPRMNSTQRIAIGTPAIGLLVFDNQTNSFWFYNGAAWTELSAGNDGWGIKGNAATNPATNFIGTTDNQPLRFKVNNSWAGEINPSSENNFFGVGAGKNTVGTFNTAIGHQSLTNNTSGASNTAIGNRALFSNTVGYTNTAIGAAALYNNTAGNYNTAIGVGALFNSVDYDNTAVGYEALYSNTDGFQNTAVGKEALYSNVDGYYNTAIGNGALFYNTKGDYNTAIGKYSLVVSETGKSNVGIGFRALGGNISGSYNIAIGETSGTYVVSGSNNIAIGYNSGSSGGSLSNTIGIGNGSGFLVTASNEVVIGNTSTTKIGGPVGWSVLSDARIKNTITEDVKGLDFILRLRPVTYHISHKAISALTGAKETPDFPGKYDNEKIKYTGFLAQEVEQAAVASHYEFSGYSKPKEKGGLYMLSYEQFVVPLAKAVQEQQEIIVALKKQMDAMKQELAHLQNKN